jgi:hypothetical protein
MAMMFAACAKKSDSSSSSSTTTTDSSMVTAMPSNLSVSSNTESGASVSSRTAGRTSSSEISDTSDPKKHKDKVARLEAVLNSDDINQCHKAIPKKMKGSGGSVNCFGPELAYVNHPSDNTTDGTLPSGDLGIWTAYSDNTTQEACAVGQMNKLLSKVGRKVDLAMGITAMMVCAAKNDGLKKPAVDGAALDVTASVAKTKVKEKRGGMVITSATLKRSTVVSTGKKKYTSKITGSFSYTLDDGTTDNQSFAIKFQHVPDTDSTDSVKAGEGLVQMWQEQDGTDQNCGTEGFDVVTSVAYKNTSDNLSFRAVKAKFADNMTSDDYFNSSDKEVVGISAQESSTGSGWCADLNVVRANIDKDGFGKVGYAWQAGKGDGFTRTFNIKTDNSSGTLTGDAYFGFNPHPDNSSGTNKYRTTNIDRMICNWAGPGQDINRAGESKVQRQQLSYDSTNNVWKSTSDNITFAPTNDCDFDNSSYGSTTFGGSGASITNNLESISNYTTNFGSQPTKPSPTLE